MRLKYKKTRTKPSISSEDEMIRKNIKINKKKVIDFYTKLLLNLFELATLSSGQRGVGGIERKGEV